VPLERRENLFATAAPDLIAPPPKQASAARRRSPESPANPPALVELELMITPHERTDVLLDATTCKRQAEGEGLKRWRPANPP
jgi:hypothetical protein